MNKPLGVPLRPDFSSRPRAHPHSPDALEEMRDLLDAAKAVGQQLLVLTASAERDFGAAFDAISQHRAGVLIVGADPFFFQSTDLALMLRHHIPTVFTSSEAVIAGGLVSYSGNIPESFRLVGAYADRILKGAKPAELPVQQSTRFELVINLKTSKVLGLDISPTLLARADEVIE
jgi:putative ABC transport system substrate-binding protein